MLRALWFRFVRSIGRVLRPCIAVKDPRRTPLPGQVEILPARTVAWDLSKLTYVGPRPLWMQHHSFRVDAAFVVELKDAECIGPGIVLDRHGAVILESALFRRSYLHRSHVEHLIIGRRLLPPQTFDRALPLANYLDGSYYHWTMESVGRLAFVEDRLRSENWRLLLGPQVPRYVASTLEFLFGFGNERVERGTSKRQLMRHCLMVSNPHSAIAEAGNIEVYAPEHIRWLNRRGHERIGGVRGERQNFIISRRKQPGRHIVNEAELIARYPALNLRSIVLEDLSLREQVDLFAHAGLLIAVHGAGLTNLVYAKDAAVIEFYPTLLQHKNTACFIQVAATLGLRHLVLHYEGTGQAPNWDLTIGAEHWPHLDEFIAAGVVK